MAENNFKNTYVIDMEKLNGGQPIIWTTNGGELPIKQQISNSVSPRLFSQRYAEQMIAQYPILFPVIGKNEACTIIEYVADNCKPSELGRPLVTIYPNGRIDVHEPGFETMLSRTAIADYNNTYKQCRKRIEGLSGVLRDLSRK